MARYGIRPAKPLGVSIPFLRSLAREIGVDHPLALRLWRSGVHEARILASFVADPETMTDADMERWVGSIDSWDLCDQCCGTVFLSSPVAYRKCRTWSRDEREYVKRAGFALMARLAVHDKSADDVVFRSMFPLIVRGAYDGRNFVRKAVNWALRQIGKRNRKLNNAAVKIARGLSVSKDASARWVGRDALRELTRFPLRAR
jgi:3-methyladenine DNA glycosylase AlkD